MLSANGLFIQVARLEPASLSLTDTLKLAADAGDLRSMALKSASLIIGACTYPFKATTVETPLGRVTLDTPPSTQTRFLVAIDCADTGSSIEAIFGKAPAMVTYTKAQVPIQRGSFCSTLPCTLLEAAVQYESARRLIVAKKSPNKAASLRLDRLSAALDNIVNGAGDNPFVVTSFVVSDGNTISVSLPRGSRPIGNYVAINDAQVSSACAAVIAGFTGSDTAKTSLGLPAFQDALRNAIKTSIPYMLPLGSVLNVGLSNDQRDAVNGALATYIAQPAFLLDVIGSAVDSIDPIAYSELIVASAKRLEDILGADCSFSTKDVPRSLDEIMYFDAGITDLPFLRSVHAFYHRELKPEIEPVEMTSLATTYARVHPALVQDDKTWIDNRSFTVKLGPGSVDVTLTYPDFMGQDISYRTSDANALTASAVMSTYDAVCDYVYASLMQRQQGSLSPERLAQLGIPGVTTSTTFTVWSA